MTCFFLDTEFIDDGCAIDLISIALVEECGQSLYLCNSDCPLSRADDWVKANVINKLPDRPSPYWCTRAEIAREVEAFVRQYTAPYHFWAYFADYDWVAFCQLWGRMLDLPEGFPRYCRDIKQEMDRMGLSKTMFPRNMQEHSALADAQWVREVWLRLRNCGL